MKFKFWTVLTALSIITMAGFAAIPPEAPPTVFRKEARILFQGDSITDGGRGRGADPNHILGHGYVFLIAAKYGAAFPEQNLDFLNRGVSGNTVLDLERRWQKETLDLKPDVLSLLIGVNDHDRKVEIEIYERSYSQLIDRMKATNPEVKLVLCEPFGLPVGGKKSNWDEWYGGLKKRQEVVARLAKKHGAALARFQSALDEATKRAPAEHWIWDGVHPTYSGHQILAQEWERAVREFWPEPHP